MVFCNNKLDIAYKVKGTVTILILIDGFLQCNISGYMSDFNFSHNPYFNRWFSAIKAMLDYIRNNSVTILILIDGFLQLRV